MTRRFVHFSLTAIAGPLIAGAGAFAMAAHAGQPVGSVTLVLGQAAVVSMNGARHAIHRGSTITPGDRVETEQGGHVHIRFIDDALVSVRPSSRLTVEAYEYDPARVTQSQVRFKLEAGVARAISGAAAEGAKERFRLNTPLVAIGVRGTDFVVNSQAEQTTAHVNQGAIVMAPLGTGCTANTLGPCNTSAAMLVSAQMGDVLAEYRSGLSQPELKPQLLARASLLPAEGNAAGSAKEGTQTAKLDSASADKPEGAVVQASSAIRNEFVSAVVASQPTAPPPPSMAWGHWASPVGSDDFSEPFRVAAIGREVTVGSTSHVLYRGMPLGVEATAIQASLGQVNLGLAQASAQFRPWGGVNQDALAGNGVLSLDFAARTFQTRLQLDHASGGSHLLSATGVVLPDGIFGGATTGQKVIGATALDGKSAGYFFDKTVDRGVFSGITLWGK